MVAAHAGGDHRPTGGNSGATERVPSAGGDAACASGAAAPQASAATCLTHGAGQPGPGRSTVSRWTAGGLRRRRRIALRRLLGRRVDRLDLRQAAPAMSRMRVSPDGWVDRNCGGAPLLAGQHLLPQRDAGARVVAGAWRAMIMPSASASDSSSRLKLSVSNWPPRSPSARAAAAQAEQRRADADAQLRGGGLAHALARVLEQRVRDLVAHDRRDLVVVELQLGAGCRSRTRSCRPACKTR